MKTVQTNADGTVYIPETGGVFFGYTAEQVQTVADRLTPNYQSHNLSYTFSDQYFNHCLRKELSKCSESQPTSITRTTEPSLPTTTDESGRSKCSINKASSSD
jgi:hypothetical protein